MFNPLLYLDCIDMLWEDSHPTSTNHTCIILSIISFIILIITVLGIHISMVGQLDTLDTLAFTILWVLTVGAATYVLRRWWR